MMTGTIVEWTNTTSRVAIKKGLIKSLQHSVSHRVIWSGHRLMYTCKPILGAIDIERQKEAVPAGN